MPIETVAYPHLGYSGPVRPVIVDKNFKVIQLIREDVAYGWSAEELALNHPQLTLGEVYSALAIMRTIAPKSTASFSPMKQKRSGCTPSRAIPGSPPG